MDESDAPPARRRRWPWIVLTAVAALVLTAWAAGPGLACALVGRRLPVDLGHGYELTGAATRGATTSTQARLALSPARARALANSVDRLWLPPGLLRSGLTLDGTGRLPRDLVDFEWRVAVAHQPRPTVDIRLTADEANDLFSPYRRLPVDREHGVFLTWMVREATARDDDAPGQATGQRRVRVDAIGEMRLEWRKRAWRVEVRHLIAHLDWTFTPVA